MEHGSVHAPALTHVGLLTDDVESLVKTWERLFLVRRTERRPTWYASDEGVLATYLPFPGGPVEPIQPIDAHTMQRRLFDSGTRGFHLSLVVPDVHAAVAGLRARGAWTQLRRPGRTVTLHRGWVDLSSAHGTTVELIDGTELAGFRPAGSAPRVEFDPLTPTLRCVGLVVEDLDAAVDFYTAGMGFAEQLPRTSTQILGEEVDMVGLAPGSGLSIEMIRGVSPAALERRLGVPTPGIAYLGFESSALTDLARHLDSSEARTAEVPAEGAARELWIHPDSTGGIAVRIRQATPTV
jgi:catechol 2,3-dioxygenase-like lactoylglutathione lyase family enzyme